MFAVTIVNYSLQLLQVANGTSPPAVHLTQYRVVVWTGQRGLQTRYSAFNSADLSETENDKIFIANRLSNCR